MKSPTYRKVSPAEDSNSKVQQRSEKDFPQRRFHKKRRKLDFIFSPTYSTLLYTRVSTVWLQETCFHYRNPVYIIAVNLFSKQVVLRWFLVRPLLYPTQDCSVSSGPHWLEYGEQACCDCMIAYNQLIVTVISSHICSEQNHLRHGLHTKIVLNDFRVWFCK